MRSALVCVAAGRGTRFGGDKLSLELAGRTVLEHALAALRAARPADPLVVVVDSARWDAWHQRLAAAVPSALLVAGGSRRQDSVRAGVEAAAGLAPEPELVVIHDGARPAVDPADVNRVVDGLGDAAGAVLASGVHDTVKRVDAAGLVVATVPRDELRLSLTPQVFRLAALREAWRRDAGGREWTDEAALLEAAGLPVRCVLASSPNPKLTTLHDLAAIRVLLEERTWT